MKSTSQNSPAADGFVGRRIMPYLTPIAHGSAPFITTFVLIHLTAPVVANIGGTSLSSQVMLLGREYYQTSFGEKFLVLAPLIIHPMAGVAKRLLSTRPSSSPRPVSSTHSSTGYLALLVFLPIHYLTHRVYPTLPSAPIYAIGPAELDYEFVKTGLQTWPWRSWALYLGLIGCVSLHSVEGVNIIWTTWFNRALVGKRRRRKVVALICALPIISGIWHIWREENWLLPFSVERYVAAYSKCFLYSN